MDLRRILIKMLCHLQLSVSAADYLAQQHRPRSYGKCYQVEEMPGHQALATGSTWTNSTTQKLGRRDRYASSLQKNLSDPDRHLRKERTFLKKMFQHLTPTSSTSTRQKPGQWTLRIDCYWKRRSKHSRTLAILSKGWLAPILEYLLAAGHTTTKCISIVIQRMHPLTRVPAQVGLSYQIEYHISSI